MWLVTKHKKITFLEVGLGDQGSSEGGDISLQVIIAE
jgi:hypothetical protein